jgi:hypothetical protein
VLDTFTVSRLIDTRAGANIPNHQDLHVDALIDCLREATTDEGNLQAGWELQRYVVAETMIYPSLTTLPFIQAARTNVKGYEQLNGVKIHFERRVFAPLRGAATPKPAEPHSARGGEAHGCDS